MLDIGIEFEISYMMKHLHLVYSSLCVMLHCYMTQWIFCSLSQEANLVVLMIHLLYMHHLMLDMKHMLVVPFLSQV